MESCRRQGLKPRRELCGFHDTSSLQRQSIENMFGWRDSRTKAGWEPEVATFDLFKLSAIFQMLESRKTIYSDQIGTQALEVFMVQLGHIVTGQPILRAGLKFQHALGH